MRAIVQHQYGPPDVLQLREVDVPAPVADGEVLIQVMASSVNPSDWQYTVGSPLVVRLLAGLFEPRRTIPGSDVAGRVEAVGDHVQLLHRGDEVFGWVSGAYAEYVKAAADRLAPKPANLSFEEAAVVPIAALTALQGVRDKGRVATGQQVLINGASGGVGTFAVQIARSFGAIVTAVCRTSNVEMVRSIGAREVIDYTREDFVKEGRTYDVFIDLVGNRTLSDCRSVLGPRGVYVLIGGPQSHWTRHLMRVLRMLVISPFVGQRMIPMLTRFDRDDLLELGRLLAAGEITPVIGERYELSEVPEALRHQGEGHARGKRVITCAAPR